MCRPKSEVDLVVMTWVTMPETDPRRKWLRDIWHRDLESDIARAEWTEAVNFCRNLGLVSVEIQ